VSLRGGAHDASNLLKPHSRRHSYSERSAAYYKEERTDSDTDGDKLRGMSGSVGTKEASSRVPASITNRPALEVRFT